LSILLFSTILWLLNLLQIAKLSGLFCFEGKAKKRKKLEREKVKEF